MIRRALVAMDGSAHGAAAATLAIEWARRFDAELIGLGILDKPSITSPEPVSFGGTAYKRQRDEIRLADAHRQVLQLLTAFHERCNTARVQCSVVEDIGAPHEQIVSEAFGCDVVVLGRETHFQFETQDQPDATLSKVLRESPRPVVVVPREPAAGNGVLVAYGSGREVARTLQTFALLGLAGDEPVAFWPSTMTWLGPRRGSTRRASSSPLTAYASLSSRWRPRPRRPHSSWMRSVASGPV